MLRSLNLLQVYDNSKNNIIKELQIPLLSNSNHYLRGVGYFSSGWLRLAAEGLSKFIINGGRVSFIVSPNISEDDWDAMINAKQDKIALLSEFLFNDLDEIKIALENDTKNLLAWMIHYEILDFKFAIPRDINSIGEFHDKVGVFDDLNGDYVVTHGSMNDSFKGSFNGESVSVFKSWNDVQKEYAEIHKKRMESLWRNEDYRLEVFTIPEVIKKELIKIRTQDFPPFEFPSMKVSIKERKYFVLHDYQKEAIEKWKESGYQGIFEMATGTGKTITSLSAAKAAIESKKRLAIIIIVPYLHLLEQWYNNCIDFSFNPIVCSGNHPNWVINVKTAIQDYNLHACDSICIIAVNRTASSERFQNALKRLKGGEMLLIGDEVHGLGSTMLRECLIEKAQMRLGLSATPRRWLDEEGTAFIFNYFKNVCFEYPLEKAIGKFLTPYLYHPKIVNLTNREFDEYQILSDRIKKLAGSLDEKALRTNEFFKILLIKRARIISKARNKIPLLLTIIERLNVQSLEQGKPLSGVLVYCAAGTHKQVLKAVSELGLKCHEFVYSVSLKEREELLSQFADGTIQVLVAIKCLDEGVDVPSTKIAFILASSTNPKEFIQRRGRILRLSKEKKTAEIYDFLVFPEEASYDQELDYEVELIRREMPRFAEFSELAENKYVARDEVKKYLDRYGLLHLLDYKPWEIHRELEANKTLIGEYDE